MAEKVYEDSREILTTPDELRDITRLAKLCLDATAELDDAVVSDRNVYNGIPHNNDRRTFDIALALRDTPINKIDIELPIKDPDVRVLIRAHALDIPGRLISMTEWAHPDELGQHQFFADDSHAITFARNHPTIEPLLSQSTVAEWLYSQAGLSAGESQLRAWYEMDPVNNASLLLSARADKQHRIRQIALPLGNNVALHGQIVESYSPQHDLFVPVTQYSAWLRQVHEIDNQAVTERLVVESSPQDIWLASQLSPLTKVKVLLETENPDFDVSQAAVRQAAEYEDGGAVNLLSKARDRIEQFISAA